MTWLADQVGMQDQANAQTMAYLRSVYGDQYQVAQPPRQIAGESIDDGQHIYLPPGPKTNPWPWIALIAALVLGWAAWARVGSGSPAQPSSSETLKPGTVTIGITTE